MLRDLTNRIVNFWSCGDICTGLWKTSRAAKTSAKALCISNNRSFRLKHPGVLDGSDGSDGTLYLLTENYALPVAQAMGRVAYSPPLLCPWYTHHQNDTCVTLFSGAVVMM
jgi:hypothetical protein